MGIDCKEEANVKMLIYVIMDFQNSLYGLVYNPKFDEVKKPEFDNNYKGYLQIFTSAIGTKKFLHADTPRYSDFKLYENLLYIKGIYP